MKDGIDAATRMMVVYIAGPFSGSDGWEVACNVHRANERAREVARLGAAPLTPHAIGAQMNGTETYEFWCAATLEMLRRCDAVLLVDDWAKSRGARGEVREAVRLGLPCFLWSTALGEWLAGTPAERCAISPDALLHAVARREP